MIAQAGGGCVELHHIVERSPRAITDTVNPARCNAAARGGAGGTAAFM
jgi:hypothetical protein